MQSRADRWVAGVTLAAMVALAGALLALGLTFYAPQAHAQARPAPTAVDHLAR